jgi:hypothetical protein
MVKQVSKISTAVMLNIFLASLVTVMISFIGTIGYTYFKLLKSPPLDNLLAYVTQPVHAGQPVLEFTGTYDRDMSCSVAGFHLLLHNSISNDVYVLDRRHLVVGPAGDKGPGTGLKVEFTLEMPSSLKSGFWTPTFEGDYVCKLGIFTDYKHQTVKIPGFYVYPEKKN